MKVLPSFSPKRGGRRVSGNDVSLRFCVEAGTFLDGEW